ncbi:MAG: ABC transporter permease, partial [Planctomycetota bacterium]
LGLSLTAWQILVGSQELRNPGDLARFGAAVFALLSPLLMYVCLLFSALLSAAAVCQEKDRKTLILLLLSDLTNTELVLGKLLASMLTVLVVIASTAPFLLALTLLGGISYVQVGNVLAVTLVSSLASGSLGSLLALWREKTFQALALAALAIVLWLVGWEVVASGAVGRELLGVPCQDLAAMASPSRAIDAAVQPALGGPLVVGDGSVGDGPFAIGQAAAAFAPQQLVAWYLAVCGAIVAVLNGVAIAMIRVWNPSREARPTTASGPESSAEGDSQTPVSDAERFEAHRSPGRARRVWENPVLWREVRTWAYGKKILVIKFAYVAIFLLCAAAGLQAAAGPSAGGALPAAAAPLAPLLVVSVILVNALAVTSLTTERDGKAIDLLLATDLTPR